MTVEVLSELAKEVVQSQSQLMVKKALSMSEFLLMREVA